MLANYISKIGIIPSELIENKDIIWMFHNDINALFKYDKKLNKGEFVCSLEEEASIKKTLIGKLIIRDNTIFMIPMWGNYIHIYGINSKKQEILQLKDERLYRTKMLFCGAFMYGNDIYCIPMNYQYLIRITADNTIEYLFDIGEIFKKIGIHKVCLNRAAFYGKKIVAVQTGDNRYIEYELENQIIEVKESGIGNIQLNSVEIIADEIYLCGKTNDNKWKVYRERDNKVVFQSDDWITIRKIGKDLLIDTIREEWFVIVDHKSGIQKRVEDPILVESGYYKNGILSDDGKYYYSNRQRILKEYENGEFADVGELEAEFDINMIVKGEEKINEIECFKLENFVELI
ncbi:hypothetical protein SAMN04487829_1473 [Pseudobutyrivibrio sp. NOR37]|uniref:Uncharacterized protein n=1 Tax=Pseudobutyrivibrio xylanivorans TaxID=185007 RepID=A0A6M0LHF6_PSEXY|nr:MULTISPECIES: hypothetical protein [Pseudobutyrivibrio]NEX01866.1 hypothetical protein [Pseudobutyrivibrio xylanivorans]SFR72368.1 hypothetical protein SAMN04487829_1473 [Pseudobutyrivibrio sp. NOR37]